APTPAGLIAEVTARFVAQPVPGLYHLAPAGETSWFGYAQLLVEEAIAAGAALRLSPAGIRPIAARDYPTRAKRPLNSRLDTRKLRQTLGISLPAWQEGVRQLIKTLRAEGEL
ncbi:MAG TPA: sugar nucleotide-binding protein, partial [Devosia sp.]|nr:sugar nucleotide-binding protein [Devosia sp.]